MTFKNRVSVLIKELEIFIAKYGDKLSSKEQDYFQNTLDTCRRFYKEVVDYG